MGIDKATSSDSHQHIVSKYQEAGRAGETDEGHLLFDRPMAYKPKEF
jgi:hypothetical protein